MITLKKLSIQGEAESKKFSGEIQFQNGLQIFSAKNGYGKSSISSGIAWCLGLDPIFVSRTNDSSMLPEALRTKIKVGPTEEKNVTHCAITLQIARPTGETMEITRSTNPDPDKAGLPSVLIQGDGKPDESRKLRLGWGSVKDETAGFQNVLLNFIGLRTHELMTFQSKESLVYFENIAPLFFIDQLEGWSNIQAQQVTKYGLLQIYEAAIESLLGLDDLLKRRFHLQRAEHTKSILRAEIKSIFDRINKFFLAAGDNFSLSIGNSKIHEIAEEYNGFSVEKFLNEKINWNYVGEKTHLAKLITDLRAKLGAPDVPEEHRAFATEVSARVIGLQRELHEKRELLSKLTGQIKSQEALLHTIEHREHSAHDLLKLKRDGVGFPKELACPTCQKTIEPQHFNLISQDVASVEMYISALRKERALLSQNIHNTRIEVARTEQWMTDAQQLLRAKESALGAINSTISGQRQAIVNVAAKLSEAERRAEKLDSLKAEIDEVQKLFSDWQRRASDFGKVETEGLGQRPDAVHKFENLFRKHLFILKHSAVSAVEADAKVHLDEHYTPLYEGRRLRTMGSASDQARLVLAYTSALMLVAKDAGKAENHPGFILYDEPYQQNPDEPHKKHLIEFFKYLSTALGGHQVVIFTSLTAEEQKPLSDAGVRVINLPGEHFLSPVTQVPENKSAENAKAK